MAAMATEDEHLLIVGTYSENLGFVDGKGKGLYAFRLTSSGTFGAATFLNKPLLGNDVVGANPTYLCKSVTHDDVLYVVDESNLERGARVRAIRVDKDACTAVPLGESLATGDSSACHVAATETHVYVANYCGGAEGAGSCAAFHVGGDGSLKSDASEADLLQDASALRRLSALGKFVVPKNGDPERQDKAHAHMCLLSSNGTLLVPDLGADVVWRLNAPSLTPMAVACKCDDGDGPRHAAWHPSLDVLYVLTELSCRLLAFRVCRQTGKPLDKTPFASSRTLPRECYPPSSVNAPPSRPKSTCAALVVHPSGKFAYASNRAIGVDGLVSVISLSEDGAPFTSMHVTTGGRTPREIALVGSDLLLVANQDSSTILSFAIDQKTGALAKKHQVACPTPVCLLTL
ncbi:unnamed protein product [Pelagomonas calceolata]|uniref:6-phosphogluconolactonase n=1 Tax=Pelagomonas calceolata TaxID=35677 RepID=A0A8J2S8P0_9STRA|nr:unnamed protein product [Pelagomonas calceolata]|mmetsp:Transcript_27734/g.83983  ORF Transcript_27734/g.83983 Transcript_27734/m.83983 type:complete len:403 (-) Transcript_27734:23-1231(-)